MRHLILSIFIYLLCYSTESFAQKYDANWVYPNCFNQDSNYIWSFNDGMDSFYNSDIPDYNQGNISSYSTKTGKLFCYSTGDEIYNTNFEIMENGDSISYNPSWNLQQLIFSVGSTYYGSEFVPWPSKEDSLAIFLQLIVYHNILDPPIPNIFNYELWYSIVDIKANNGLGRVISKTNILEDSTYHFVTIQHANGRDWWIVSYNYHKSLTTVYLFGPDGIVEYNKVEFPLPHYITDHSHSPLVLSGKGDWIYKSFSFNDGYLFHFDRCTGDITFNKQIAFPDSLPPNQSANLGFRYGVSSPEGKYIYGFLHYSSKDQNNNFIFIHRILQADVTTNDPVFKDLLIPDSLQFTFAHPQTDPLGKIRFRMSKIGGNLKIGTIHRPDNLLDECGLEVPTKSGIPEGFTPCYSVRFPYYRMGPLLGSDCDTLISSIPTAHPPTIDMIVSPNPTNGIIHVETTMPEYTNEDTRFQIMDALGTEVYSQQLISGSYRHEINVSILPPGIYFIRLIKQHQILAVKHVVKIQ